MKNQVPNSSIKHNFILQQGFCASEMIDVDNQYSALLFQPRIIGIAVFIAILFQSPAIYLSLAGVLIWSVLLPRFNLFDVSYNIFIAQNNNKRKLSPAPPPRKFAQSIAGLLVLIIGVAILLAWYVTAYVVQGLLAGALISLNFGSFCLGSFLYLHIRGKAKFARRTAPWRSHKKNPFSAVHSS
ncbi:MAG: DUF4395 family protein [Caldithrix sp.]|nr:DUF4395 family protein [Caldithrix sp.]